MKRSELERIVNEVALEQKKAIQATVQNSEDKAKAFSDVVANIPLTSAAVAAEVLVRCGLLTVEESQ